MIWIRCEVDERSSPGFNDDSDFTLVNTEEVYATYRGL